MVELNIQKMKLIKNIIYIAVIAFAFVACDGNDSDFDTTAEVKDTSGGLLIIDKTLIGYVVGDNGTYTASGRIPQADVKTTKIDVYKTFTNSSTGESSNENLLTSIDIANITTGVFSTYNADFKYEDLINGLTIGGVALPANDGGLNIGDYWTLRYETTNTAGGVNTNYQTTKVAVGTRFAGTYKVIASNYYRIGVDSGNWDGSTRVIESVDATTYKHIGCGPFEEGSFGYPNEQFHLFFEIDANDKVNLDGIGNTTLLFQPYMSCTSANADFQNTPCDATSNRVIRDDATGKDQIFITYGYYTAGSGPREFYELLEKIVD